VGEAKRDFCTEEGWWSRPDECSGPQEIVPDDEGSLGGTEEGSLGEPIPAA
jgi:hypothetical protein